MRFLTAVALALVMLWVPVDGVGQRTPVSRRVVGAWNVNVFEDAFTDEKTTVISPLPEFYPPTLDSYSISGILGFNITCEKNVLNLMVMTRALTTKNISTQGPRSDFVSLTYRFGDAPLNTVTVPISYNNPRMPPYFVNGSTTVNHSLQSSELLPLLSSPRIAFRVEGTESADAEYAWRDLAGTAEAVRSLPCVR